MSGKKIKVFIVDDHEIFRNGVKQLINQEPDMEVIGEASSGEESLAALMNLSPDVVIMDIRMPGINGLDTSKQILKPGSNTKILFFSLYDRDEYVISALDMGAHGYILKDTSNKIFLNAIRAVFKGEYYFIGEVSDIIVKKYLSMREGGESIKIMTNTVSSLSKREGEILNMIRSGMSNKDIADNFGISIRTIEAHRLNILRKFKTNSFDEVLEQSQHIDSAEE